jgi:hypothetical protein
MYVSTLFITKLELPSCPWPVECVKIMFFNFVDNDPIELIFDDKLRSYVYCKVVLVWVPLRKLSAVFRHSVFSCLFQKNVSRGYIFDWIVNNMHKVRQQRQIYNHGIIRQGYRNFVFLASYSMQKHICAGFS